MDWYVKAEDIVLRNKGNQNAGNPQNNNCLLYTSTRTWFTKTIAETDSDGTTHYITKLTEAYKVSGDSFYMQDGKAFLPLGTLTVEETKAPNGYLLDGAYTVSDTHLDVYKRQPQRKPPARTATRNRRLWPLSVSGSN